MTKRNLDKTLTIRDIREVLIPAMEAVFATKKDLEKFTSKEELVELRQEFKEFKDEMMGFKDEMMGLQEKILKDIETLMTEKEVSDYQMDKHRKMWQVVIPALEAKRILTPMQLRKVKALRAF